MGGAPVVRTVRRIAALAYAGVLAFAIGSPSQALAGSAQRWVGASDVLLREANQFDAPVISRLSLNAAITLLSDADGSGYCEVQAADGRRGFMHCRYLALAPAIQKNKTGLTGARPAPFLDWQELKAQAAKQGGDPGQLQRQNDELANLIGVAGLSELIGAGDLQKTFAINLVRALEFQAVRPSFFRDEKVIAPPWSVENVSGHFGIPYRQSNVWFVREQQPLLANAGEQATDKIESETVELAQPVQMVRLFRSGSLTMESRRLRETAVRNEDMYAGECDDWMPGFAHGDAEDRNWKYVSDSGRGGRSGNANPRNSLYAFYMTLPLPRPSASRTQSSVKLDPESTGFVGGTHLYYDLDGDGVADLAVWEGQGVGGHPIVGPTTPDHRWYRLVLVNINGAWKILGRDAFDYGCGC